MTVMMIMMKSSRLLCTCMYVCKPRKKAEEEGRNTSRNAVPKSRDAGSRRSIGDKPP